MPSNSVLRWLDGSGWLLLAGGEDSDEIHALALGRLAADGGVAYVMLGQADLPAAEQMLADLEDLGAPPGYLVDVLTEDDDTIQQRLGEAGMIVMGSSGSPEVMRSALLGAAAAGIQEAYVNGAVILAQGTSAALFGTWLFLDNEALASGLEWLESALVLPGVTSVADNAQSKALLATQPGGIAIGVGVESALALGPAGEVETWGRREVTIALGQDYST